MADQALFDNIRALDAAGDPVAGAEAYFYESGTSTPLTVYTTSAGSSGSAHPSPLVADANGMFPAVFVEQTCKVDVQDPDTGSSLPGYPKDVVPNALGSGSVAGNISFTPSAENTATDVQAAIENNTTSIDALETFRDKAAIFCTTGGTADAVTLTTGNSLAALVTGMTFMFFPDANNTTTATINVDGIGAVTCKTVTGANLPADYLREDVMSTCWYDGTNIIVDRLPEYGANAAGKYWRYANGHAVATADYASLSVNVAGAVGYRNNGETKNMPITFAEKPSGSGSSENTSYVWINARASTTSEWTIGAFSASSQTGVNVKLIATGRWYS